MRRVHIERRTYTEKFRGYLARQFGDVQSSPISALQIVVVRKDDTNYPEFAPLRESLLQAQGS